MLNEKEAWLKMAEWFKLNNRDVEQSSLVFVQEVAPNRPSIEFFVTGMCDAVKMLELYDFIDMETRYKMSDKIDKRNTYGGYMFPENEEGDKQRVNFCLERANELNENQ